MRRLVKLWVVGGPPEGTGAGGPAWTFRGAFDSQAEALDACGPGDFLAPTVVHLVMPDDLDEWPGLSRPRRATEGE